MLDFKISSTTVKDNILTSPYIINVNEIMYTKTKGIWTINSTVEDIHKMLGCRNISQGDTRSVEQRVA
eukprot:14711923-Ditylum_brightwellii.AAC.1